MNAQTTMEAARTSAGTAESAMSATVPRGTSCWTKRLVEVKTRREMSLAAQLGAQQSHEKCMMWPCEGLAEVTFKLCVEPAEFSFGVTDSSLHQTQL